jgi:hypothetical protein
LAACHSIFGNAQTAQQLMREYMKLEPAHTAVNIRGHSPAKNAATEERFVDAQCNAGLPR